jgi:flagellar basal body rod protein FlgG
VLQGVLEGPNVEPLQALVEMVTLLRHFEMNEKALHAQDDSLGTLLEWARG